MALLRNLTGTTPVSDDGPNVEKVFSTYLYDGNTSTQAIRNGINLVGEPVGAIDKKMESSFSTHVYNGNGSGQTIKNGIDLATDGGMTWCHLIYNPTNSAGPQPHHINDTVRGNNSRLELPGTAAAGGASGGVIGFNSDGFEIGSSGNINATASSFVSWTFKKEPRFFDIVEYTGNATAGREIPHNLGVAPGMMIVKDLTTGNSYIVYHKDVASTHHLSLHSYNGINSEPTQWNSTDPTSTNFTVGISNSTNGDSTHNYIAYLFAHDPLGAAGDGSDGMIACGSYTGNSTTNQIDLGWEAQYVLIKRSDGQGNWGVVDNIRGNRRETVLNSTAYDGNVNGQLEFDSTGFNLTGAGGDYNYTGYEYVYMAIRKPQYDGASGAIWIKRRDASSDWTQLDTERGTSHNSQNLNSATTDPAYSNSMISTYNPYGVTFSDNNNINGSGRNFASYTFKKAERFFDVVTYTGDSVYGREIPHDLGCDVGMMIVKCTNTAMPWAVYHKNSDANPEYYYLNLDTTAAKQNDSGSNYWNQVQPTSTNFTVGNGTRTNNNGYTYVAYLFAHDPDGEDNDGMIACGSYSPNYPTEIDIDLGWEPQFVLVRATNQVCDWAIFDSMRGVTVKQSSSIGGDSISVYANTNAGDLGGNRIDFTATGFRAVGGGTVTQGTGTRIYMAIRAPMMKEPEAGTEVFAIDTHGANRNGSDTDTFQAGFPVDMAIKRLVNATAANLLTTRMLGQTDLSMSNSNTERNNETEETWDSNTHWNSGAGTSINKYSWMFKRAKGFFDCIAYTGNGSSSAHKHSLGVVPEMMIIKRRDSAVNWLVFTNISSSGYVRNTLNTDGGSATVHPYLTDGNGYGLSYIPTSDSIYLESNGSGWNNTGGTYIAHLFATATGVSKVGNYTGNGSNQNIACGFSGGARFVMIKRTDSTGDWYLWDTARGIVAGNESHISLNETIAEVTTDDSIDPYSTGFTVNQVAATNINVTSGTYIFLAIA